MFEFIGVRPEKQGTSQSSFLDALALTSSDLRALLNPGFWAKVGALS
jgi:hypothetical protein